MAKLGVIGKPSDWLIASDVDYKKANELFDIELVDIDIKELIDKTKSITTEAPNGLFNTSFNKKEIDKAYQIYLALKDIIFSYKLDGITVRCFDLLDTLHSTSCLAFALLNKEGYIATCEGDIPSMISMYIVRKVYNLPTFQANPSRIDVDNNEIIFAHCTLPLSMCESYRFDTHYESGIGVGIKGELKEGHISIFKVSPDLTKYVLLGGEIKENLNESKLCRTQIVIKLNQDSDVKYFLQRPLANHHLIFYSYETKVLKDYLNKRGLIEIK